MLQPLAAPGPWHIPVQPARGRALGAAGLCPLLATPRPRTVMPQGTLPAHRSCGFSRQEVLALGFQLNSSI